MTSVAAEPVRALLHDVPHPVHRLHVVLERRPPEQADLREIRRAQTRFTALAFDRFDHRGLFAADVRAGPSAQMNRRKRTRRVCLESLEFALEDGAAAVILVAKIDIDFSDAHSPRGHKRAFDEAMRVSLEVVPILERAGLALVDVDRHQARRRLGSHDLPLAAGWKARAAQAAKA